MTTSTSASAAAKEVFDLLRDDLLAIEQEFQRDAISGVEVKAAASVFVRHCFCCPRNYADTKVEVLYDWARS